MVVGDLSDYKGTVNYTDTSAYPSWEWKQHSSYPFVRWVDRSAGRSQWKVNRE